MNAFAFSQSALPALLTDLEQLTASAIRYRDAGNDSAADLASTDALGVAQEIRARFLPDLPAFSALLATAA
jgi:hypothetical protein